MAKLQDILKEALKGNSNNNLARDYMNQAITGGPSEPIDMTTEEIMDTRQPEWEGNSVKGSAYPDSNVDRFNKLSPNAKIGTMAGAGALGTVGALEGTGGANPIQLGSQAINAGKDMASSIIPNLNLTALGQNITANGANALGSLQTASPYILPAAGALNNVLTNRKEYNAIHDNPNMSDSQALEAYSKQGGRDVTTGALNPYDLVGKGSDIIRGGLTGTAEGLGSVLSRILGGQQNVDKIGNVAGKVGGGLFEILKEALRKDEASTMSDAVLRTLGSEGLYPTARTDDQRQMQALIARPDLNQNEVEKLKVLATNNTAAQAAHQKALSNFGVLSADDQRAKDAWDLAQSYQMGAKSLSDAYDAFEKGDPNAIEEKVQSTLNYLRKAQNNPRLNGDTKEAMAGYAQHLEAVVDSGVLKSGDTVRMAQEVLPSLNSLAKTFSNVKEQFNGIADLAQADDRTRALYLGKGPSAKEDYEVKFNEYRTKYAQANNIDESVIPTPEALQAIRTKLEKKEPLTEEESKLAISYNIKTMADAFRKQDNAMERERLRNQLQTYYTTSQQTPKALADFATRVAQNAGFDIKDGILVPKASYTQKGLGEKPAEKPKPVSGEKKKASASEIERYNKAKASKNAGVEGSGANKAIKEFEAKYGKQ